LGRSLTGFGADKGQGCRGVPACTPCGGAGGQGGRGAGEIIKYSSFLLSALLLSALVESREGITPRPSQLNLGVRLSPHPASDNLIAHVDEIVAAFMNNHQVVSFPVAMIAVFVVQMHPLFSDEK
jgi:hypothetical protein